VRIAWLLLVAAVGAGGVVGARHVSARTANAAELALDAEPPIAGIAIDGRRLPLHDLRAAMASHVGGRVDRARLAADREAMAQQLAGRGHLEVEVSAPEVTYADGRAFVTYEVVQGPVFKLRSVTVTGATDRDAGVVTIVAGDDAIAERIEHARRTLEDTLARRGKPSAVSAQVSVDRSQLAVDVELRVTETDSVARSATRPGARARN
jgi:outer membrane protein assembly factor BamA